MPTPLTSMQITEIVTALKPQIDALAAAADINAPLEVLKDAIKEQQKTYTDAVALQNLLSYISKAQRQLAWATAADRATLTTSLQTAVSTVNLTAWLAGHNADLLPDDRLDFFVNDANKSVVLSQIITTVNNLPTSTAAASTTLESIQAQWQKNGLALQPSTINFEKAGTGHHYKIVFKEGSYHDVTTRDIAAGTSKSNTSIHLTATAKLDEMYDRWAEIEVLAKMALLKALYSDHSEYDFAVMLSKLTVENKAEAASDPYQQERNDAYKQALDRAYENHGFGPKAKLPLAPVIVTTVPVSTPSSIVVDESIVVEPIVVVSLPTTFSATLSVKDEPIIAPEVVYSATLSTKPPVIAVPTAISSTKDPLILSAVITSVERPLELTATITTNN